MKENKYYFFVINVNKNNNKKIILQFNPEIYIDIVKKNKYLIMSIIDIQERYLNVVVKKSSRNLKYRLLLKYEIFVIEIQSSKLAQIYEKKETKKQIIKLFLYHFLQTHIEI